MEENYNKAYKEVVEILKHLPKESVEKIPKDMREMLKKEMDKEYEFKIDENKKFEEQQLLSETKAILANIFRDYWATPYQRERILNKEQCDRQKADAEKQNMYNKEDLFKRKSANKVSEVLEEKYNINLPIEIKKEKFYYKLIKFIKKIFNLGD